MNKLRTLKSNKFLFVTLLFVFCLSLGFSTLNAYVSHNTNGVACVKDIKMKDQNKIWSRESNDRIKRIKAQVRMIRLGGLGTRGNNTKCNNNKVCRNVINR
jgi:hypothetical protein